MRNHIRRLWADDAGQGLVEYGLLVGFTAIVVVALSSLFSDAVGNLLRRLNTYISSNGVPS